jgi:glycosyltransferase involved in cell wall biosynthesis
MVYSMVGRKAEYLARRPSSIQAWPAGIEEHVDRSAWSFLAGYGSYGMGLPPVWITAYLRLAGAVLGERLLPAFLRRKLAWCDTVIADFPFVHPIFAAPSARGRRCVLSTHNIEHQLLNNSSRWQERFTRETVKRIELEAARSCEILVSCCVGDQEFFAPHAKRARSIVVPNGIDVRRFQGIEGLRGDTRRVLGVPDQVKVFLFTASKYGPNREAYDDLLKFARDNAALLVANGIHILVVGSVVAEPLRLPGFTATGKVDQVESYFAAADAALNPLRSGAGTNVKMCEYIAARLPIVTTSFGARGFEIEDGRTGFLFAPGGLAPVITSVRRLFDQDAARLRRIAADAFASNEGAIDMEACVHPLAEALRAPSGNPAPAARLA